MYSDNIIFFDGEFTTLDPDEGQLLSLAFVKMDGSSLYIELDIADAPVHPWVTENVMPYLEGKKVSKENAIAQIKEFVGGGNPFLVAKVNQFDWIFLAKLMGLQQRETKTTFHWIPIDFATILFDRGIDPAKPSEQLALDMGIDMPEGYQNHHALWDAQLLRLQYMHIAQQNA